MRKRKGIPYETLLEATGLLIVGLDADGRIVHFNRAMEELSGYSAREVTGKHFWDFAIPGDLREANLGHLESFRRGKLVDVLEQHILTRDGGKRLISWRAAVLEEGKGPHGIILAVGMDITERRMVEEKLASSEGFFRMLIENALDLVVVLDGDARISYAGPSVERLLGYRQEEIITRKITELIHPGDVNTAKEALAFAMSHAGITGDIELRIRHRDGGWRTHEATSFNLMHNPEVGGLVVNSRDITDRKAAEMLLQAQRDLAIKLGGTSDSEEALRLCLRAILGTTGLDCGCIYLVDGDTGALNLRCHEGLSPGFISRTARYEAGSENARIVSDGEPLYAGGEEIGSLPLFGPAGEEGLRALAVVPIRSQGRVIGCINAASHFSGEISQHVKGAIEILAAQIGRAIERAVLVSSLRESEENYRVTFESTGSAMVVLARDGTILDANQEIRKLLGYSREEVVGRKRYMEFVHPEDRELVRRFSLRLLSGEATGPVRYEARTVRRDGRVINTIINVSVMPGMEKSVASLMDITEKKDYELELEARAAQMRDFLDIAAHELRHPATLIEGYATTLAKYGMEMDEETRAGSLAAIIRSAEKLVRVVDDLLDVSRIERGLMSLERGEHAVLPLVRDAVAEMSARGDHRRMEITCEEDPGTAWLDPEKFTRLMVILLDNAVKYSPPGSPVDVSLQVNGANVLVSVMDRGEGVPERERNRIFERFYQSEEVLHHSSPGLGLGLYIARRIVEAHGGRIWCDAHEGGGSAFRFTIPLRG